MGKNLIQQRRGRGTLTYRSPSHRFKGEAKHYHFASTGIVTELVHCAGHSAPLMEVSYLTGEKSLTMAPEGVKIGDEVSVSNTLSSSNIVGDETNNLKNENGSNSELNNGNVLPLGDIPEGTLIHNLELKPGDGGKIVRASGTFAKIIAKEKGMVRVKLPSRKEKDFLPECRASIGIVAGAGRIEKPFLKAGTHYFKMRATNKLYPHVCGISMNAVDHPFGGKCSHIKGRPTQSPRNAPPGRKVGKIAPRRTGRKK